MQTKWLFDDSCFDRSIHLTAFIGVRTGNLDTRAVFSGIDHLDFAGFYRHVEVNLHTHTFLYLLSCRIGVRTTGSLDVDAGRIIILIDKQMTIGTDTLRTVTGYLYPDIATANSNIPVSLP